MRLAVYTDYPYHQIDGAVYAERAFAVFLAALADELDGLIVVGRLDPSSARARYPLGQAVDLVPLPYYRRLPEAAAAKAMVGSLGRFWKALGEVDGVWLLGPHPLACAFAALAALRGKRVVLGVRQDTPEYVRNRHPGKPQLAAAADAMERCYRLIGRSCSVVAVGPQIAANYRHSRRLLEIAVSLVDAEDLVSPAQALRKDYSGSLVALSVGRLEEEKNPLLLAEALAALRRRDPRWRLAICGEGSMRGELEARLAELGLTEAVEFHGYLPLRGGLDELYRSCHALLHVSWTEGLPQVLFESFAAGLPVVATDVGGIAAAVGPAVALIPAGDADAAAREIDRIGRDESWRAQLVERGSELVAGRTLQAEVAATARFLGAA